MINRLIILLVGIAFVGFNLFNGTNVYSCTCKPPKSIVEDYEASSIVFSGEFIGKRDTAIIGDNELRIPNNYYICSFKVINNYKGIEETYEILSERSGDACGYNFNLNSEYLVYSTTIKSGKYYTSFCHRTKLLSNADKEIDVISQARKLDIDETKKVESFINGLDYFDLSALQTGDLRWLRNDYYVLVKVKSKFLNKDRTVCVSMKRLRYFTLFQNKLSLDSLSILKIDSILLNNKERIFVCDDLKHLNRFFNIDKYSDEDLAEFEESINLDNLITKANNRRVGGKYFNTSSESYLLKLAHLLCLKGINTREYSCSGSLLIIVGNYGEEAMRGAIEKWRIKNLIK